MFKCKDFFMMLFLHKFYKSHFEFIKGISCELFFTWKKVQPNKRLKIQLRRQFLMHIIMLLGIQINKKRSTFMCHINGRHLLVGFICDMSYDNIWCQRRVGTWHYLWRFIYLLRIPSRLTSNLFIWIAF